MGGGSTGGGHSPVTQENVYVTAYPMHWKVLATRLGETPLTTLATPQLHKQRSSWQTARSWSRSPCATRSRTPAGAA
jgi:hypothetical protein